jgi:signal transduction histidine kinase
LAGYIFLGRLLASLQREIDDHTRTEQILRDSEEKSVAIMNSVREEKAKTDAVIAAIGDGLMILDDEFRIVYQNEVARNLIRAHAGEVCYKAYEGRDSVCENCPVELTFSDGLVHRAERRQTEGIEPLHRDITSSPLRDSSGRIISAIAIIRDITERKKAEEVLRRSHEELEILVEERTAELTMMNEQLRNLSAHTQNARENERAMIAREIHDDLGQSLTALKIDLSLLRKRLPGDRKQAIEKAESMAGLIEAAIQSVKRISMDLRPGILDHLGLTAAIEWQTGEFEKRTGIQCAVAFDPGEITVDKDRTTTLFRIFQETLTNIARHAEATKISVLLVMESGALMLQVRDNGKGIAESRISDPNSLGLIGIRERVNAWGGSLNICGANEGTTVTVRIPMNGAGIS